MAKGRKLYLICGNHDSYFKNTTNFDNISALSKAAGMPVYHQDSEADIASVYRHSVKEQGAGAKNYFRTADLGYYLIFPLLILAVFFKRGIILSAAAALGALQLLLCPAPAFAGNSEGMKYFEEGRFDLAAREFTDEFWIGNSYYKEQRYYQAVEHYEKAGNSVEVLYNLANAYAKTGDGAKRLLIAPKWSGDKRMVMNTIRREFAKRDVEQGSALQV